MNDQPDQFQLPPEAPRCWATTPRGACRSPVSQAGQSCWLHDPTIPEEAKQAARARGGRTTARQKQAASPSAVGVDTGPLAARITAATTPDDLTAILTEVAGMVAGGTMPPKTGGTIGSLVKIALECQRATFHRRLDEIERHLADHPKLGPTSRRRR